MRRNAPNEPIAPHERFTIAHELGHYVLMEESNFQAQRRSEYWLGEDLCHHFASHLLIRPEFLDQIVEPQSTADLMASVNRLARRAQVTAEPAARALIRRVDVPVALGTFLLDPLPSTNRLGFRGWWVENKQWWGGRGGRRLAVYADHPLAPVFRAMQRIRPRQIASPEISGAQAATLRRRSLRWASFAALLA